MNKLKPYQELKTTQAYALQILACHLLEAKIKAKKSQVHLKINTSRPLLTPSSQETIPYPKNMTIIQIKQL